MSNFHPLEVVGSDSETQLQVGENLNKITWKENQKPAHKTRKIMIHLFNQYLPCPIQACLHPRVSSGRPSVYLKNLQILWHTPSYSRRADHESHLMTLPDSMWSLEQNMRPFYQGHLPRSSVNLP